MTRQSLISSVRGIGVVVSFAVVIAMGIGFVSQRRHLPDESSERLNRATIQEGRDLVLNHRFLPRDFHQSTFDDVWRDWPEPLHSRAKKANPDERRSMAFQRYGFTARAEDPTKSMQYVVDDEGWWAMNCFACHGGSWNSMTVEGKPNSNIALETLYEDLRKTKLRRGEKLGQMDLGALAIPMGTSNGTSNAVVFGIGLMSFRDKDLNRKLPLRLHPIIHHDMDAPAWWNVSKRDRLYIDGFVTKNHRALIPFVMDQLNSGETMRGWEDEFKKVYAYIESLDPPVYPYPVDKGQVAKGKVVFQKNCASCHGTYGKDATYPSRVVPLEKIGTDPVRLGALTKYDRRIYRDSWFTHYGDDETVLDPKGYLAPPLDGIWASAPYLHNGSVPTLRALLDSSTRPTVWKQLPGSYDPIDVGLSVESFDSIPKAIKRGDEKRKFFDSTRHGKYNSGHPFGDKLDRAQRSALLEYLKTL